MQLAAAAGRPDAFLAGSMVLKPAAAEDARLQRRQQKETHRREQERKAADGALPHAHMAAEGGAGAQRGCAAAALWRYHLRHRPCLEPLETVWNCCVLFGIVGNCLERVGTGWNGLGTVGNCA